MIEPVNFNDFYNRFQSIRPNNFTYEGLKALFLYLENLEIEIETAITLDVIALCCDYTQYESLNEFHEYYDKEIYSDMDAIHESTIVIEIEEGGFIIEAF